MCRSTNPAQAQFGIVQGGVYPDLRDAQRRRHDRRSASRRYAIGGLSVGEPIDVMYDVVEHTARAAARRPARAI